ncbi:MAG TPA: dihydrolipoamide acetyltransferase family protein, partial [Longimicrobiales bacterium]|nr:dihydrolipoamide acetyltransferase family protein [Longimicrobiales bacterium]
MATKVHMEALSPTMEEGRLVTWLKKEGDQVNEGDVLAEIETDKATMELVARGAGVLRKHMIAEGNSAPVGTVIGVIAGADEDISGIAGDSSGGGAAAAPAQAEAQKEVEHKETPKPEAKPATQSTATQTASPPKPAAAPTNGGDGGGRVKASPLAKRLAAEAGLELRSVQGSGPGGRITKRDIQAASQPGTGAGAGVRAAAAGGPEYEDIPLTQMRKTIAKRLVTSIGPVPTFYLTIEVDMTHLQEARERINARLQEQGVKVSINDFIIKAVAVALRQHPEVNAQWTDAAIRRFHRVHVGVAVAVDDGLITPVVRDADQIGVAEISQQVRELAKRARERKLQPEEYTGATFSISNLGMFGIDEFTAIINPPEAAILAIGRVEDKPVAQFGEIISQPR